MAKQNNNDLNCTSCGKPWLVQPYPYNEGDFVIIGPECFSGVNKWDETVISWKGENYTVQRPRLRVRLHNFWVSVKNATIYRNR